MNRRLRIGGVEVIPALVLGGWASSAAAAAWFRETDIATSTPPVTKCGEPRPGSPKNVGGEAAAVFEANGDGIPDIAIVNGINFYFVALGHRKSDGSVSYRQLPRRSRLALGVISELSTAKRSG